MVWTTIVDGVKTAWASPDTHDLIMQTTAGVLATIIAAIILKLKFFSGNGGGTKKAEATREVYLRLMRVEWGFLPLEVLDANASDPNAHRLTLERVYVSLDTTSPRPDKLKQNLPDERKDKPLSAVEALLNAQDRRMVLLGQPGSGKSTFARHLCLRLAEVLVEPGSYKLDEHLPGWQAKTALLPVFVSLRRFANYLTQPAAASGLVENYLQTQLDGLEKLRGFGPALLAELREKGGAVVFDGLDEVAADCRARVKQALIEFANDYPRCLTFATCRVFSYRQETTWRLPWEDHTLADFDQAKIRQFIDGWYGALALMNPSSPVKYQVKADTLKGIFDPDDPRGLLDLAGTPLLLTVMAIVHAHKELPDSRVGVYRECVNILLLRWQGAREGDMKGMPLLNALTAHGITDQKLQKGLREVAYQAQHSGDTLRGSGNRALVSEAIIRGYMHKWLQAEGLDVFVEYCRHANGLLLTERVTEADEGVTNAWFVFPHLTFQEYLAAMYLVDQSVDGLKEAVQRAGDPAWWEVARFYGEHLCHDEYSSNQIFAKDFLERLCPVAPPADDAGWRRVWLAGALLPGWRKETPEEDQDEALIKRINQRLMEVMDAATALRDDQPARAAVGRVLAAVGDPRPGVGLGEDGLPDILWVPVPSTAKVIASGHYPNFTGLRLGTGAKPDKDARSNEQWPVDKAPFTLDDFELAAFPVTVKQFRPFVEQGGYAEDRFWSAEGKRNRDNNGWQAPRLWDDRAWMVSNHPVVGLSWYEAEAYCHWLNAQLPAGQAVRLPTEAEWEWAARGPEGWIYPWGDDWQAWRCNGDPSGIGRTSTVGCFPDGAAKWLTQEIPPTPLYQGGKDGQPPFAKGGQGGFKMGVPGQWPANLHDMSGNVWEWMGSEYSDDYAKANTPASNAPSSNPLSLRGGAWYGGPRNLRCSYRFRNYPFSWNNYRGFRLARTFSL